MCLEYESTFCLNKEGNLVYYFEGHDDKVTGMEWLNPDRFCTTSFDQTLIFWDALVKEMLSDRSDYLYNEI